ncbi:enhancer of split m4 protein [Scaptodrosophila lebanonensis]|uniref:Enhancer of split m4 protein n=1 Tax=Drosophila lebanonensis TaxID=7225 RepID=A0A6J2TI44_DROLE|nr:enhancer of split m4 protein [Scaptodrosophila lebanonensis]
MCQNNAMDIKSSPVTTANNNKKLTYSVKKLLQRIFKQQQSLKHSQKVNSVESLESLENSRNADLESLESLENSRNADLECASLESYENEANERLSASCDMEDYDFEQLPTVPVHYVRTAHGTFFWTAASDLPADNDLLEPLYCSTANEIAVAQFQDRWVQA